MNVKVKNINKMFCLGCLQTNRQFDVENGTNLINIYKDITSFEVLTMQPHVHHFCLECATMLLKFARFKRRLLEANKMLSEIAGGKKIDWSNQSEERLHSLIDTKILDETNVAEGDIHPTPNRQEDILKMEPIDLPKSEIAPNASRSEDSLLVADLIIKDEQDSNNGDYMDSVDDAFSDIVGQTVDVKWDVDLKNEISSIVDIANKGRTTKSKRAINNVSKNATPVCNVKRKKVSKKGKTEPGRRKKMIKLDSSKIAVKKYSLDEQIVLFDAELHKDKNMQFKCQVCRRGFITNQKLSDHEKRHNESRGPHKCAVCKCHYGSAQQLRAHCLRHATRYQCLLCERRFVKAEAAAQHISSAHGCVGAPHPCALCSYASPDWVSYNKHMRTEHSHRNYECDTCGKQYFSRDSITKHLNTHNATKDFECGVCQKRFRTRTLLRIHSITHEPERKYYCVECDRSYKSPFYLRQHFLHARRHLDKSQFTHQCAECEKSFESDKALQRHVDVQHRGRRDHACETCGATFASRNTARKHQRRAHEGYVPPPRFPCEFCDKTFRVKVVLQNHVRIHTGDMPFECHLCERRFAQKATMQTHIKLVHLKMKRNIGGKAKKEQSQVNDVAMSRWYRVDPR